MRTSGTTVVPANRARAAAGTARAGVSGDGLRKAAVRTVSVAEGRPDPEVVPADAEYFVHPFVD